MPIGASAWATAGRQTMVIQTTDMVCVVDVEDDGDGHVDVEDDMAGVH